MTKYSCDEEKECSSRLSYRILLDTCQYSVACKVGHTALLQTCHDESEGDALLPVIQEVILETCQLLREILNYFIRCQVSSIFHSYQEVTICNMKMVSMPTIVGPYHVTTASSSLCCLSHSSLSLSLLLCALYQVSLLSPVPPLCAFLHIPDGGLETVDAMEKADDEDEKHCGHC